MKITQFPTTLASLAALTFFVSCGQEAEHPHSHGDDSHASHSSSPTTNDGLDGLQLNSGQKWKMDDHTRAAFAKMAATFLKGNPATQDEDTLKKAGKTLQTDLDNLIQGCTMTGDAHEQLHAFLTGYIPAVTALRDSGKSGDAKAVARYLEKYGDYFE